MRHLFHILTITFLISAGSAWGQVPDSVKYRVQQFQYQRLLDIPAPKARSVAEIQGIHLDSLTALFSRFEEIPGERLRKRHSLDSIRDVQLKAVLSAEEYIKFRKMTGGR